MEHAEENPVHKKTSRFLITLLRHLNTEDTRRVQLAMTALKACHTLRR